MIFYEFKRFLWLLQSIFADTAKIWILFYYNKKLFKFLKSFLYR